MTKSEELFHKIATEIPDVKEGKMFGNRPMGGWVQLSFDHSKK